MQRKSTDYTFKHGATITIQEANWHISMTRRAMEDEVRAERERLGKDGETLLMYFKESIYPIISACSFGEVPSAEMVLETLLDNGDLDSWYKTVQVINPHWFTRVLDDGFAIVIVNGVELKIISSTLPSVLLKLRAIELEQDTKVIENESVMDAALRILYYPKMAACTVGNVPSIEETYDMPEVELNNWYEVCSRLNPILFAPLERLAEMNQAESESAQKKTKKPRKRSSSS